MKDMAWLIIIIVSGVIILGFIIGYICRKSKTIRAALAKNHKLLTKEDIEKLEVRIKNEPIQVATLMIPDTDTFAPEEFYKKTIAVGHSDLIQHYIDSMGEEKICFYKVKEIQINFKKKRVYAKVDAEDTKESTTFKFNPAHIKIYFDAKAYWMSGQMKEAGIQLW